jgi:hypothetical protein
MISPLSPSYLIQNTLVQNNNLPQHDANQQIQSQQNQIAQPPTPPIEGARPRPENFSSDQFSANQQSSAEEIRSQQNADLLKVKGHSPTPPAIQTKPAELYDVEASARRSQSDLLIREVGVETRPETPNTVLDEDRPTPNSKPAVKTKSPFITQDYVVAGQIVDSLA